LRNRRAGPIGPTYRAGNSAVWGSVRPTRSGARSYMIDNPPSTISVVPVMNDASSEASQRIGQPISAGSAQRPISDRS